IITEQPNHSVRSDHSPGEGSVLRAVIVASARSVGSVGLGLSSVLNDLTSLPGRLGRIGDATGWTVPGTATVPSWNAR
ncbi:MAG: hypothetical protein RBS80_31645, partial [Thermoguttaceae bacterium]|nr:hypothetical protein [Thermoguttaceae bacterium]